MGEPYRPSSDSPLTFRRWAHDPAVLLVVDPDLELGPGLGSDCRVPEGQAWDLDGIEVVVLARSELSDRRVQLLVERLSGTDLDAAGRLNPVVDAVKAVDADGVVTATVDRSTLATLDLPVAVRRTVAEGGPIERVGLV
jgi:hypothetical protein